MVTSDADNFGVHGIKCERHWVCSLAYPKAKVQQEEDVERHVDLQREVFVEVLTRLDRTVRGRDRNRVSIFKLLAGKCGILPFLSTVFHVFH